MKKQNFTFYGILFRMLSGILFLTATSGFGQTIMFDDFTYSGVSDPQLPVFNKWSIVNGTDGPPEGAQYSRNNINFISDPANSANKLMTLNTTVNGQTKATTHARIETTGFEYFEGTYAARVYLSDEAFSTKDANIQTFFTIVSSSLAQDGSKYSELDIVEYMAADKWGISPDNQVLYTTSYHKYIADPWKPYKTYFSSKKSWAGWHTFIASCTDKVNVKYWIDDTYLGAQSVTDNETQAGLPVYPRSNMQVAFANWIWNNVVGSSTANRTNTMQADWVLYYKNTALTLADINTLVASYRSQGIQRRNLAGQVYSTGTVNQAPSVSITSPSNNASFTAPASITINSNASDADGSISKVEFYNGNTLLGTDNTSPYSYTWSNVGEGSYSIKAVAYDNLNASATATVSVKVNPVTITQSPYGGTAWPIPGTIEAENYDIGGQGVAFNEVTIPNEGGAYRTDAVDIEPTTGGGNNVGYIITDEWLEYTVNITAGTYKLDAKVAAIAAGKTFRIELDGATIATVNVPNTGAWQTWQTVSVSGISVTGGTKILRLYATSSDFNIDKITFSKVVTTNQLPTVSLSSPTNNSTYQAPASITISANASDADGSISKVEFYNGSTLLNSDNSSPYSYAWNNVSAGTYSITAKAYDNTGASTTSSAVSIKVNSVTTSLCSNVPTYVQNGGYVAGSRVQLNGKLYECKPWPYSGWCNAGEWAYAPGTGYYWQDAWIDLGACSANSLTKVAAASPSVNESVLSSTPNPFSISTMVQVKVETPGEISVKVYDKSGVLVSTLFEGFQYEGTYTYELNSLGLSSDVYIVKFTSASGVVIKKVMKSE